MNWKLKALYINRNNKHWDVLTTYKDLFSLKENHDADQLVIEDDKRSWYRNGKLHRVSGPAVEFSNGSYGYYLNGAEKGERRFFDTILNVYYPVWAAKRLEAPGYTFEPQKKWYQFWK